LVLAASETFVLSLRARVPEDVAPFRGDTITVNIVSESNPAQSTFAVVLLEVLRTLQSRW